jgi:hypothetical protein
MTIVITKVLAVQSNFPLHGAIRAFLANTPLNLASLSYSAMSNALKSTEKDIVYAICNWGEDSPWLWASVSAALITSNFTIDSL